MMRPALLAVLPLVLSLGCHADRPAASQQDATAQDVATLEARLRGTWRLVDWRPEMQLEPMLETWLASQRNLLVVRLESGRLSAQSPTVQYNQPYQLTNVAGGHFTLTAPSNTGTLYQMTCDMTADSRRIQFHADTAPFRGAGVLERL